MERFAMENVTALGIVVLLIVLTDRWIVRFYRAYKERSERQELSDQQLMLVMLQCSESLVAIRDSLLSGTLLEK